MMLRVCCGVLLPCQKISKKLLIAIPQRSIASFVEVPSRPSSCRAAPKNFELRGRPGSRGRWWCMIGPIRCQEGQNTRARGRICCARLVSFVLEGVLALGQRKHLRWPLAPRRSVASAHQSISRKNISGRRQTHGAQLEMRNGKDDGQSNPEKRLRI